MPAPMNTSSNQSSSRSQTTNQSAAHDDEMDALREMTEAMKMAESGGVWTILDFLSRVTFVTCHAMSHSSHDIMSHFDWWLMSHVTKFTILNSFTNSIKDLSSSRVFYLQRFNWLRFEFRLRRPIMINLLEPIRIIRLRRLKFRLDQILWEMTLWRHISVNCVSQMVAANQIRVFQQEPLRKNLGQLPFPDP